MKNYLTLFIAATLLCGCYKRNLAPTVSGASIISTIPFSYRYPTGVVADKKGNVYISYGFTIEKVDKNGKFTTVAGGGKIKNYEGMPATVATLYADGLAIDAQDNLYFTSSEYNRITKIDQQGIAHIIAGPKIQDTVRYPRYGFGGDGGPATDALMEGPNQIAVDGNGNVYFSDGDNFRIRKINAQGIISTVIGGGNNSPMKGGMAVNGGRIFSYSLTIDKNNNLYADYNGQGIIKITPDGRLSTIAGGQGVGFTPDGTKAIGAKLGWVYGLALDANGHVYFSEYNNHLVRMIDGLGILHTVAGIGTDTPLFGGIGSPAIQATTPNPHGLCFDSYGNLYIASVRTWSVYKVSR